MILFSFYNTVDTLLVMLEYMYKPDGAKKNFKTVDFLFGRETGSRMRKNDVEISKQCF